MEDKSIHLRFPEDLSDQAILFEAKKWELTEANSYMLWANKSKSSKYNASDSQYNKTSSGSVALYLPSFSENMTVQFDATKQGATHIAEYVKGALEAIPFMDRILDMAKLESGVSVSQDTISTFKDVDNRKFTFDFDLLPRSEEETKTIKGIIDFFRYHSLPEYNAMLIAFPSVFDITVIGLAKFGGTDYIQLKPMFLTELNVTYGDGTFIQLMVNDTPSKVKLSLSFEEVRKPYKGDFEYSIEQFKTNRSNGDMSLDNNIEGASKAFNGMVGKDSGVNNPVTDINPQTVQTVEGNK